MLKHSLNGKGIMAPMEYTPTISSLNVKAWLYERVVIKMVVIMVKDQGNRGLQSVPQTPGFYGSVLLLFLSISRY